MNWYFIIYIALSLFGLGLSAGNHGKSRKKENFWTAFISAIICNALVTLAVLHGGILN